jgi:chaperonin GroES
MGLADFARKAAIWPILDYLLVEMQPDRTVIGSIIVPATACKRPNKALVIAVGPGRFTSTGERVPNPVRAGDLVLLDPYRFKVVLADGALANAEKTPFADIGERAIIGAEHAHCVLECTCASFETSWEENPRGHNVACPCWGTRATHACERAKETPT